MGYSQSQRQEMLDDIHANLLFCRNCVVKVSYITIVNRNLINIFHL